MRDQCVNAHWDHGGPLSYEAGSMEIERWPVLVLQRAGWLVGGADSMAVSAGGARLPAGF